jgi:DNA-binding response OmpR family regulator
MKKVFLVESDPLQLTAWEIRLRDSDWSLYSLESLDDFDFRLKDFEPDLIVLGQTFGNPEAFEAITSVVAQIPVAIMAFEGEPISNEAQLLKKPITLASLPSILDGLLG